MLLNKIIPKSPSRYIFLVPIYFNHYQTLNISPTATEQQIKQSFLKLAKKYHPDSHNNHNQSSTQNYNHSQNQNQQQIHSIKSDQFIKIKQAYDILKQPNSRKLYDMEMFPQKIQKQSENFYFYRQAQFQQNHFRRRQQQKRKINFVLNSLILLSLSGYIIHSVDIRSLLKPSTQHQIRRQNIILANQIIDDGPITQQRRRKQYENQIREKKIYGNVIELKVRGAAQQTTKAREKRLKGIGSIEGVQKQKSMDLTVYQDKQEYM